MLSSSNKSNKLHWFIHCNKDEVTSKLPLYCDFGMSNGSYPG